MIADEKNYGEFISELLSKYLRDYTSTDDWKDVSKETGVGYYTIRNVIGKSNTLTKDNALAIQELMKLAILNCNTTSKEAKKAEKFLKSNK